MFRHFFLKMFLFGVILVLILAWMIGCKGVIVQHYSWMKP